MTFSIWMQTIKCYQHNVTITFNDNSGFKNIKLFKAFVTIDNKGKPFSFFFLYRPIYLLPQPFFDVCCTHIIVENREKLPFFKCKNIATCSALGRRIYVETASFILLNVPQIFLGTYTGWYCFSVQVARTSKCIKCTVRITGYVNLTPITEIKQQTCI